MVLFPTPCSPIKTLIFLRTMSISETGPKFFSLSRSLLVYYFCAIGQCLTSAKLRIYFLNKARHDKIPAKDNIVIMATCISRQGYLGGGDGCLEEEGGHRGEGGSAFGGEE